MTIRLAIVGLGKIARDQHIPAIEATAGIAIEAVASRNAILPGIPSFPTMRDLLASELAIDAVALCTPPQVRSADAAAALRAGLHVLMEKPPGATVGEIAPLVRLADAQDVTLFATWHSRFAPAVEPARALLAERKILSVDVAWREDVRVWHPGQRWLFEAGGLGVFDPGINALSILTHVLPRPPFVTGARLDVPSNCDAPIAASVDMTDADGLPIWAEFDFQQTGPQTWDIRFDTAEGDVVLSRGGSMLSDRGRVLVDEAEAEYRGIYRRFVALIDDGDSDVDLSPLSLVADAFLVGRRRTMPAFHA